MSGPQTSSVETQSTPQLPVRVTCWPARQKPVWNAVVAVLFACAGSVAGKISESPLMGLLAASALILSTWRRWVPITFEISRTGVERIILGRKFLCTWQQVGRYEVRPNGIWLLPEAEPTPGEFFCGLFIEIDAPKESLVNTIDHCFRTRYSSESSFILPRAH